MTLYTKTAPTTVLWPEPMESTWQWLPSRFANDVGARMPHLSLADRVVHRCRDRHSWSSSAARCDYLDGRGNWHLASKRLCAR